MSFLNLFGRHDPPEEVLESKSDLTCPHVVITPRWDSVADIGHEDRATGYQCTSCGVMLSVDEGREARTRHIAPVT